jgi:hypothetical protein
MSNSTFGRPNGSNRCGLHSSVSKSLAASRVQIRFGFYGADESRRSETGTELANRVQVLEPLAIGDIGLPTWHVLHVLCVNEVNFEAARFQDLGKRVPSLGSAGGQKTVFTTCKTERKQLFT